MINSKVVGILTLKKEYCFTQYTESAAWTRYVTCLPQSVELKTDGYWVFGKFRGTLTSTTIPKEETGIIWDACVQTQKFGGIGNWMDGELFDIKITAPDLTIKKVSEYSDGKPMFALQKI